MHFQLQNHNLFEKLLGTKSCNTKRCHKGSLAELYSCILLLTKDTLFLDIPILPQPDVDCHHLPPPSPEPLWETLRMGGEFHPAAENLLIFTTRKIPQQF